MKSKFKVLIPILIILVVFSLAYNSKVDPLQDQMLYKSEPLKIGIIGEIPIVREDIIEFQQMQFKDIENDDFNTKYDAIIITNDNLSEAAQDKYAKAYRESKIPFFFIGSAKGTLPFTDENISYEDAPFLSDNVSFDGILYKNNIEMGWSNSGNVKNPSMRAYDYSNIFQMVYDNKYSK